MNAAENVKNRVPIRLITTMVTIGFGVNLTELAAIAGNWRLVTKAALANYAAFSLNAILE